MFVERLSEDEGFQVEARSAQENSLLCAKLIEQGAEFSRALVGTTYRGKCLGSAHFETELLVLQRFPEQLESKYNLGIFNECLPK